MKDGRERFGAFIRREREAREIGLRQMAKRIKVSPTYLSKVEREQAPSPVEAKVRANRGDPPMRSRRAGGDGGAGARRPRRHHSAAARRDVGAAAHRQRPQCRGRGPHGAREAGSQERVTNAGTTPPHADAG